MLTRPVRWTIAALAAAYAVNLGATELTSIDECRSALIARDMAEGGNWLLPRTPDGYLSEKPPVYYALAAAASAAFGEGERPMRGVSVVMAIGTLIVIAWIAQSVGPPGTSILAVLVLGSNLIFISWARSAMVDMTFTFFLSAGMAAYLGCRLGTLGPWSASALCGVSFGLCVLSKGPLGLAFPAAAVLVDLLFHVRGGAWKRPEYWGAGILGLAIVLEVSLLWYLPGWIAGGREFLNTSLLDENIYMPLGMAHGIAGSHVKPFWYYPTRQLVALLPVVILLPEAVRRFLRREAGPAAAPLAAWIAGGFLVLFVASNKRGHYLLPLQPALALLIAAAIAPLSDAAPSQILKFGSRLMGAVLAIGAMSLALLAFCDPGPGLAEEPSRLFNLLRANRGSIALAGSVLSWTGILMFMTARERTSRLVRSVLIAAAAMIACRTLVYDPIVGTEDRIRPFVAEASRSVPAGSVVAVWPPGYGYGLDFYWPTRLERGPSAATRAEHLFVREGLIPNLTFSIEVLGIVQVSAESRRIALVRRL